MSNFFKNTDLSRNDADNIVSDTLNKCDDGELYLENSKSESILLDDNKIKNSSYNSDLGFGFRAVSGEVVAYSHSNEISKNSLKQSADNLKSTLKTANGIYNHSIPKSNKKYYANINPIEQKTLNEKIEILNQVNEEQVYQGIKKLIQDSKYRKKLCYLSYKNFKNDLNSSVKKYDKIRDNIFDTKLNGGVFNGAPGRQRALSSPSCRAAGTILMVILLAVLFTLRVEARQNRTVKATRARVE